MRMKETSGPIERPGRISAHGRGAGKSSIRKAFVLVTTLWLGFVTSGSAAVEVSFDIQPRILSLGETARAVFIVRGLENPPLPTLPAMEGLQVQSSGRSQKIQILNGETTREIAFEYQLLAVKEGRFIAGPLQYPVEGSSRELPPVQIDVTAAPSSSASGKSLSDALFAVLETSKTNRYVQETFLITLSVYSLPDIPLTPDMNLDGLPSGGVSLSAWEELEQKREKRKDQIYDVRRFRARLRSLTAGALELSPTLRLQIRVPRTQRRGGAFEDSFFDSMFNRDEARLVELPVQPLALQILPLPTEGRPAGFNGAVGRFRMEARVQPVETVVGEPVTFQLVLSGEGNLDAIAAPKLDPGTPFRTYDYRLTHQEIDARSGIGTKTFEQVLLPLTEESTQIPEVEFAYFNPERSAYETLRQGPFLLRVKPAAASSGRVVQSVSNRLAVALPVEGSDILYLKSAPPGRPRRSGCEAWGWVVCGLLVPPLVALGFWAGARRRDRLRRDVALARRTRAPRIAREKIRRAEVAAREANRRAVFEAIWQALASYYGNRLNLSPGDVTEETVSRSMACTEEGRRLTGSVQEWFRTCEIERFGAGTPDRFSGAAELSDAVVSVSRLLRSSERVRMR